MKKLASSDISGGRVSNTWATCPVDWDNSGKPGLIPNNQIFRMEEVERRFRLSLQDGPAAH